MIPGQQEVVGRHPVWLVIVAGIFILGAGQWANGQSAKARLVFLAGLACALLTFLGFLPGTLLLLILYPISVIDAHMIAERIYRGEPVTSWTCFYARTR